MKRNEFAEEIELGMLRKGADRGNKVTLNEVAEYAEYNNGSNLGTAIRTCTILDKYLVRICIFLNLPLGKMFELKMKFHEEQ